MHRNCQGVVYVTIKNRLYFGLGYCRINNARETEVWLIKTTDQNHSDSLESSHFIINLIMIATQKCFPYRVARNGLVAIDCNVKIMISFRNSNHDNCSFLPAADFAIAF